MTRSRPDHPRSRGVYAFAQFQAPDLLDHPRSRGVYASQPNPPPVPIGSSPLARGLLTRRLMDVHARRIIPARAGFTTPGRGARSTSRDHPRSRGVYATMRTRAFLGSGSSPLARGLLRRWRPRGPRSRIIPARAGFTRGLGSCCPRRSDHPRSRGVYTAALAAIPSYGGSSPLARGLLRTTRVRVRHRRIIPARAGFTRGEAQPRRLPRDHPRSRGVYDGDAKREALDAGSSPLARGLLGQVQGCQGLLRIIPARAGFTTHPDRRHPQAGDHPRSRGVYIVEHESCEERNGSSPLARGLRRRCRASAPSGRIIPARAGFTRASTWRPSTRTDHPRSRGVYSR